MRRRGRGEGSIVQRRDGRWMARVDLGWIAGRRKYKAVYGKSRKDVASRLPKLLQAAQQGTVMVDERTTTGNCLDRWLGHKQTRLRPRTFSTYQLAVELHLVPGIGKIPLARLTPQHLEEWFQAHHAAGASAHTIQYARAVLRAALNQAPAGTLSAGTWLRSWSHPDTSHARFNHCCPSRLARCCATSKGTGSAPLSPLQRRLDCGAARRSGSSGLT